MLLAGNLPHYKLTILPAYLDSMYAHPKDEIYYPATFEAGNIIYKVQARFKGSTSLSFNKKSWAIKFDNNRNYFGKTRINLHSDFKDHSAMRNFLILRLFDHLGYIAPRIQHVTYEVNGQPYGVYTQVEQIDAELLARNGRTPLSLYKATNHGALLAPAVRDEYYRLIWEIEEGGDPAFDELRVLFNKCLYWTKEDFEANIGNVVDVDNFLQFFAIHFVFADMDNFTKNIFLNKNSTSGKFEYIPWDNEGSFGNSALGVFDPALTEYNLKDAFTPEYQVALQRLLESPAHRALFNGKIQRILDEGYTFLDTLIDNTYLKIKQDVYADTRKEATNTDFDNAIPRLKSFMANRKIFLQNNALPERHPLTGLYVSNPFPTPGNPEITFRITSPVSQPVNMFFADSVNFNRFGQPFKFSRLQLYDDGQHNDLVANDLVYGNTINTNTFVSKLVPFTFTGAEQNFPPNGIFYIDYYGSKSYAINKGNNDPDVAARVKIGLVYKFGNKCFIQIINTSATQHADISYYHVRSVNAYDDFMFRDNVVLAPNETIYIAPNKELGLNFFPNNRSFYSLYYNVGTNDWLNMLSSVLTPVVSTQVGSVSILTAAKPTVVFNEINFKSSSAKPSGDWVEIYNPGSTAVDLTGWTYKDGNNNNKYNFPQGFVLEPDAYVVVAEDLAAFKTAHPQVDNVLGNAAFGLSGEGEPLRLFDHIGQLIDSAYYKVSAPWPTTASGTGHTLELRDHYSDNTLGENWYSDVLKTGSPGRKNYISTGLGTGQEVAISVYPNPASEYLFVRSNGSDVTVEILTLQGMMVQSAQVYANSVTRLDISALPKGIYLVKATGDGIRQATKLIVR